MPRAEIPPPTAAAMTLFQSIARNMHSLDDVEKTAGRLKRILKRLKVPDDQLEEIGAQFKEIAVKHFAGI